MNSSKLALAGTVLALLSISIFAMGLVVIMANARVGYGAMITPVGSGFMVLAVAGYLVLVGQHHGDAPVTGALLAAASKAIVAGIVAAALMVIAGAVATFHAGFATVAVLALVGIQGPIGLAIALGYLRGAARP